MLFNTLLLFDAFVLGGTLAMIPVMQLLESTLDRLIKVEAQQEILNVIDHLIPYWLGYIGVSLLLGLTTIGRYVWLRTRSSAV
jgi:hypothetical protein